MLKGPATLPWLFVIVALTRYTYLFNQKIIQALTITFPPLKCVKTIRSFKLKFSVNAKLIKQDRNSPVKRVHKITLYHKLKKKKIIDWQTRWYKKHSLKSLSGNLNLVWIHTNIQQHGGENNQSKPAIKRRAKEYDGYNDINNSGCNLKQHVTRERE